MSNYKWNNQQTNSTYPYVCPHCNKDVAGTKKSVVTYEDPYPPFPSHDSFYVLQCPFCGKPTIYNCNSQTLYPSTGGLKPVQNLPDSIAKAYEEIRNSLGAGCYTSTVVFARTLIAHIAVDKGAKENCSFAEYVNYLAKEGFVPPNSTGWIDKIRVMGNTAVHDLEFWGKDDAMTIGKFVMYLLVFIYELPNQI